MSEPHPRPTSEAPNILLLAATAQLDRRELLALVAQHVSRLLAEQLRLVVPLASWLLVFQWLVLRQDVTGLPWILLGLVAVVVGLMLFMEGLRLGLMPLGETLGRELPARSTLSRVLGVTLLLGIGVTFAEPAIAALRAAAALIDVEETPYLYALLELWRLPLVLAVGSGVGLAALLGTLRLLRGWSLKPLLHVALLPTLILTGIYGLHPDLQQILGLAWDSGAVTTGPVTVPIVLALGVGVASAVGTGDNPLAGFGVVTLASLFPVLAVLLLGLAAVLMLDPADILAAAAMIEQQSESAPESGWLSDVFGEVLAALQAVVPLVLFLLLVLVGMLRSRLPRPAEIAYGIVLCIIGMALFKIGVVAGLAALGEQVGRLLPTAFVAVPEVDASPLYDVLPGIVLVLAFGAVLGLGATMAEPALNALGTTVEELTDGAFRNRTLRMAVSIGVAAGVALGIVKLLWHVPLPWLLLPGYGLALVLTWLSREEFVNVAWDSAGVTTGPITVPLVIAMGLGLGGATGALQGFGILALASLGPIVSVLTTGLWARWQARGRLLETRREAAT
ncbi:MAG: DUF1538 family protein [Gammaproteobacteria bacterium]|nr:DUF1538 family protein [Gammaproteobacteria bacterium]